MWRSGWPSRISPGFDLRRDITRFLMEGLAQQDGITFNHEQRMRELFGFLKLLYTDKRLDAVFADIVIAADNAR